MARDLGCLLDVDDEVDAWSCLPASLGAGDSTHVPDFLVRRGDRHSLVDAGTRPGHAWLEDAARECGCGYETVTSVSIRSGARLANARDLLRYSNWQCPLGDRVRLLAALDEVGSMTVAECLPAFRETAAIAGLSSLVLHRFVTVNLDEARIGPETMVRRCCA
ncbi:hypothetical protein [Ollibium composti]|uniref:hypothetical protein n=1 Tax=Ollibium composti TaxID=2675109 RepID=UPI001E3E8F39|nr:hypothetical protein [Mesorhizobium composti]